MDFLKDLLHSFIPIPENDYKPHFFRLPAVIAVTLVIVMLAGGAFALQSAIVSNYEYIAAVVASALVDLTNGDRSANGLSRLALNPVLQRAAELKAADMAAKNYFAHNAPDGTSPWHWFNEAGYNFA
ncbi:MAG: CAP domain-containing protein, partial [Patescibacteria group bacterium]